MIKELRLKVKQVRKPGNSTMVATNHSPKTHKVKKYIHQDNMTYIPILVWFWATFTFWFAHRSLYFSLTFQWHAFKYNHIQIRFISKSSLTNKAYWPLFHVYYLTTQPPCLVSAGLFLPVFVQHSLSGTVTLYASFPSGDLPSPAPVSADQSRTQVIVKCQTVTYWVTLKLSIFCQCIMSRFCDFELDKQTAKQLLLFTFFPLPWIIIFSSVS